MECKIEVSVLCGAGDDATGAVVVDFGNCHPNHALSIQFRFEMVIFRSDSSSLTYKCQIEFVFDSIR